jgi:hypothetical protein
MEKYVPGVFILRSPRAKMYVGQSTNCGLREEELRKRLMYGPLKNPLLKTEVEEAGLDGWSFYVVPEEHAGRRRYLTELVMEHVGDLNVLKLRRSEEELSFKDREYCRDAYALLLMEWLDSLMLPT